MRDAPHISRLRRSVRSGLSVGALGLSAFCLSFVAIAADTASSVAQDPSIVSAPSTVDTQADSLRNLFEVAGRNGLVDFKNGSTDVQDPQTDLEETPPDPQTAVPDCLVLAPLFDGGQGGFSKGLYTELSKDRPETAELAATLADLIDPSYDGRPLPINLSRAGECGPSFLPWQVLAAPGRALDAAEGTALTVELGKMDPALKRQLGMQIAIRSGLAGNMRVTRRLSDTLIDAGLHGKNHHRRDPENILLDAIMRLTTDAVGARARLAWLAERDGPEQLVAIDLMRRIDASPAARTELKRLAKSPDANIRNGAEERLLATAIEEADIALVMELVTTTNNLAEDDESRERLAARLAEAIETGDTLAAVQAMDVIDRLEAKGVPFDPSLKTKAAARIDRITSDTILETKPSVESALPAAAALETLSGPDLTNYLGAVSADMTTYREVLSRG